MLVQIKAKQDEILNDYAQNCITDVTSCLNQNNYPISTAANNVQQRVAINACRNTVITCMSVTGYSTENPTPAQMANWVYGILGQLQSTSGNETTPGYVQSQLYVYYTCGNGSSAVDTTPVAVETGEGNTKTFQHNASACSGSENYTCKYYWAGTDTVVDSSSDSITYPYAVSKTLEYRCTEDTNDVDISELFDTTDGITLTNSGGGNSTVSVGKATGQFTFNVSDVYEITPGYACTYTYNGRTVCDGDVITSTGNAKVTPICSRSHYSIT